MKTAVIRLIITTVIMMFLFTAGAVAQTRDFQFHWDPSPVVDEDGVLRPKAQYYEVWFQRANEPDFLVGTTAATNFVVQGEPDIEQRIRVRAVDSSGRTSKMSEWSDPIYFSNNGPLPDFPTGPELSPNYPNPFNPETTISYAVPRDIPTGARVRLEIFAVNGQRVRSFDVDESPGWHEVSWNGRDDNGNIAATGMYVTMFAIGDEVVTNKMTMLK